MIFPQMPPPYYDENDRDVLSRMEAFETESITINQSFWAEADTNNRFEVGDQSLWNDYYGNGPSPMRRRQFMFNRIRPIVNMIGGYQRRNRKSTIVMPLENADSETADQFTKILMHIDRNEGVSETISEAFHGGALVSGMNLLQVWLDFRSDPINGDIKINNCPYNYFIIDPFFKKHDLSDCRGVKKRSFLTRRECISLMPDKTEQIMELQGYDQGSARDGKFQFAAEAFSYGIKNLLAYDEFYYRDYRTQKMLVDTKTGGTMEWKGTKEKLEEYLGMFTDITVVDQEIPTVRLSVVIQGRVLYDGPNPLGIDKYPFVPVFGYYNPQLPYYPWRCTSVVSGLRDAQYLYNRRLVTCLDILESMPNSGWIYKENALVNPKDIFLTGQGRGIALKTEAQMSDVQQIQPPNINAGFFQINETLGKEINFESGVNEEMVGSAVDEKAGVLAMLRQGAGLTTLQILFDNLDRSQKLLGNLQLDIIQANWTPGKIKKILEGQNPSPQFYNKAFGKYHSAVEEGINTTTQRQMQLAQMLQLKKEGVPIPDESIIEAATFQNKKQVLETMQRNQQQVMQMQQMQLQAQMKEQEARTELAKARSIADEGLGIERLSRVQENKALAEERRAAAVKDEETGLLNLVRALKEIDGVELDQIEKLYNLANIAKQHEAQLQQPQQENQVGLGALK